MAVDRDRLHRALTPRTVAVVGAKGPDFSWIENQREFQGPLYSVQLDPNEITEIEKRGFTNYLKLEDVPDDIDLVICAVPRNIAPYIVSDAVKKGVGGMAVFTAGFAETGQDEGLKLQEAIVEMANAAGMPIVGPNCMGVYNRRRGVKFHSDVDQNDDGGNVSIVGQSGTHHDQHDHRRPARPASGSAAASRSVTPSSSTRPTTSSTCATTPRPK